MSRPETVIELQQVSKVYRTGEEDTIALNQVDLKIEPGEFVAIMGPSGSGKSTMMHIIGLLDEPTSGRYLLDGEDVSRLNPSQRAEIRNSKIGFVFQQFNLLPRTSVTENVMLPTIYGRVDGAAGRAASIIEQVGLKDRAAHLSNQLSGGQIQRVAIARALMMNPSLILADEPSGNLVSRRSLEILGIFREINEAGATIVLITHEKEIAAFAQRTVNLRDGAIINGSSSEIPADITAIS